MEESGRGQLKVRELRINGFRNLNDLVVHPGQDINVFHGLNGAGKTSILESLFLLGRPRSFRGGQMKDWLAHGKKTFSVFAELESAQRIRRIGIGSRDGEMERRLEGSEARSSELARLFPVMVFEPGMHGWLEESPDYRRMLLDWYMFHVEPSFHGLWQRFRRILRQRNAALRQGSVDAFSWDDGFVEHSCQIDRMRQQAMSDLVPHFEREIACLAPQLADSVPRYRPGADLDSSELHARMARLRDRELSVGSSQAGCHRFDWRFDDQQGSLKRRASRGQQKLLLLGLMLSQAKSIKMQSGLSPILLLDDFAAELDRSHQERTLSSVAELGGQVFVSTLDLNGLDSSWIENAELFHVEHGRII